ncbi:MAG: CHAT domain-containing protein [Prochlorotrichaceae cyanobacterium]
MDPIDLPSLSLAIAPLTASEESHWAIWVTHAPYPGGHVHHDRYWTSELSQLWQAWQALFSLQATPNFVEGTHLNAASGSVLENVAGGGESYASRLMQSLGIDLWNWLFDGPIHFAFAQSQGISIGQHRPLRIRLDVRSSMLIPVPWEIMQPQTGKRAIGLNPQILFSRTTNNVDALMPLKLNRELKVLSVLGDDRSQPLRLKDEAQLLQEGGGYTDLAPCEVTTLTQPSRAELLAAPDSNRYNLFVYGGHGMTAPDGGRLFLQSGDFLGGTELAQSLVRNQIPLAVFNTCWGARLDYIQNSQTGHVEAVPRSSLAETLIHHGVPAVLGMRDVIADPEALNFIERLMQALRQQYRIDEAVTIARQHLLGLYGFNQPSWTLPVLYMHPEFNGQLITRAEARTELPTDLPYLEAFPQAELRSQTSSGQVWPIEAGLLRVGRREENDLVLAEQWVSQHHAEIICRTIGEGNRPTYFIKDFSRFGTLMCHNNQWQRIHRQEVSLPSGTLLRFGSAQGELLKFVVLGEPRTP